MLLLILRKKERLSKNEKSVRINRVSTSVPPRFEQYKNQGTTNNLVQSHFRSPASKWLESGIVPPVSLGFYPACWGVNQPPPLTTDADL